MNPKRPIGRTKFHAWAQGVHDKSFSAHRQSEAVGANVSRTTKGNFVNPLARGKTVAAGWRWASPIIYDKDKTYAKGEIVVIIPTAGIVVTGADDHEAGDVIKAIAGTWIATRTVAPVNVGTEETPVWEYHVPQWPLYAPDAPDDEDVYWFPGPFYPKLVVDCVDGVEVSSYANIQPETEYE